MNGPRALENDAGQRPDAPVAVRTRFERFPATVKGAFVFRGIDGYPHTVRIVSAAISRVPTGILKPVPVGDVVVDVAPARDFFVPFEASISDLESSWYVVRLTFQVDVGKTWTSDSRLFVIPWPSGAVRRGVLRPDATIEIGEARVVIDRVELKADSAALTWRTEGDPSAAETVEAPVLVADGTHLESLPIDRPVESRAGVSTGRRTLSYPVFRSCRSLAVAVRLSSGEESEPVSVPLR